ncbi:MAG TPA: helix-turn-helix domain-containing protein, partial [Pirellulaceae bacterium]|nr:helix-turn-helix domain-containing protein [Pirellulaceae bacterium]
VATNRDLEAMIAESTFRPDLYYRLNGFTIKVPPLRERGDDLLLLIEAFLSRYSQELNKSLQRVSPEALKILVEYSWPGNVRELQSMLRKALLNLTGPVLVPEFLPDEVRNAPPAASGDHASSDGAGQASDLAGLVSSRLSGGSENLYAEALEFMERYVVTRVLQTTGGNQSKAAKILGITRGSLRNKTHALGIKIGQVVSSGSEGEEDAEEETK